MWCLVMLTQPKSHDYDQVRKAISDLMASDKAEEYDDGVGSTYASVAPGYVLCASKTLLDATLLFQALLGPSLSAWLGTALEVMTKVCILSAPAPAFARTTAS